MTHAKKIVGSSFPSRQLSPDLELVIGCCKQMPERYYIISSRYPVPNNFLHSTLHPTTNSPQPPQSSNFHTQLISKHNTIQNKQNVHSPNNPPLLLDRLRLPQTRHERRSIPHLHVHDPRPLGARLNGPIRHRILGDGT